MKSSLIEKSPKMVTTVLADRAYNRSSCQKCLYDKGLEDSIAARRYEKIREEIELGAAKTLYKSSKI